MVTLKKSDILNGKYEIAEVWIPLMDEKVALRPLTDAEYNHIEAIKKDIGKVKAKVAMDGQGNINIDKTIEERQKELAKDMSINLDLKKLEENKYYGERLTAAYGLSHSGETFQPEDLKNMRPVGVVKEIAEAVMEISKLKDPSSLNDETKDFREPEPQPG